MFIGFCAVALYLAWLPAAWDSFLAAVTAGAETFVFPLRPLKRAPSAKLADRPGVANVAFRRRASIRRRMWHPARDDVLASEPPSHRKALTQSVLPIVAASVLRNSTICDLWTSDRAGEQTEVRALDTHYGNQSPRLLGINWSENRQAGHTWLSKRSCLDNWLA